jgi:small subunit ribosomal protein S18
MADEATPTEAQVEQKSENIDEKTSKAPAENSAPESAPASAAPAPRPSRGAPQQGRGPRRQDRPDRRGGRRRFRPRRKVCSFCVDKVTHIDYKEVDTLRRFVDNHGKIIPRRKTGTCAKHQRRLAMAVKRARHLALLPFVAGRSPYE